MLRSEAVPVKIDETTTLYVETARTFGEEQVAAFVFNFDSVWPAIAGFASQIRSLVEELAPKKASIEFGIELAVESGGLAALLVAGQGKGHIKLTLSWDRLEGPPQADS